MGTDQPPALSRLIELITHPDGRLRREGEIDSGGMGRIDVVADPPLMRRLAMKVIHDELREEDRAVRMFLREAQITGQLDHPNIIPVHDLGVDPEGRLFFTMKLVQGRTLAELIDELPAGPIEHGTLMNMIDVLVKVCDALALAHSRGVIHRDVKPENIMVGDFGEVYLMDWGIAVILGGGGAQTSVGEQDVKGELMGSPSYMAPEQARRDDAKIDARTDVFGIGACLYELVTRHPPYPGDDPWKAIKAARECNPPAMVGPNQADPVPRTLVRTAERAMARKPEERFRSVNHLKQALLHFMRGGGEFDLVAIPPGKHIVREGEPGDTAYIVASGRCEVYRTIDNRRVTLRTMAPGDVFGETAILSPGPRTASVVALDEVALHVVTSDVLRAEVDSMKPWMSSFIHVLAERFRESEQVARTPTTLRARPVFVAEQLLMRVSTWGRIADDGALVAYWTHLRTALAELFGREPREIDTMVAEFPEIAIREDDDVVRIADPEGLKRTIRAHFHREAD